MLCINVYGIERKRNHSEVVPIHLSNEQSQRPTIHLLIIEKDWRVHGNNEHPIFHFALIKKLSNLLSKQLSKSGHFTWICDRC